MRMLCQVFKSASKDEMYLYVDKAKGLEGVPEALKEMFGRAEPVMTLLLTPEKRLARVDASKVLADIQAKGFYLQMPPARDKSMLDLYRAPTEGRY